MLYLDEKNKGILGQLHMSHMYENSHINEIYKDLKEREKMNDAQACFVLACARLEISPQDLYFRMPKIEKENKKFWDYLDPIGLVFDGVKGWLDKKGFKKNISRIEKSASEIADSAFLLGELYYNGSFTAKDDERALMYIEAAARQQHPGAVFRLAMLHLRGECGIEQNYGQAFSYMNEAATLGHFAAYLWMHHLELAGLGTPVNRAGAMISLILGTILIDAWNSKKGTLTLFGETVRLYKDFIMPDRVCVGLNYSDFVGMSCLQYSGEARDIGAFVMLEPLGNAFYKMLEAWTHHFGSWSDRLKQDTSCEVIKSLLQNKDCLEFVVSAAFESLERVLTPAYDISVTEANMPIRNYADIMKALDTKMNVPSDEKDEKADIHDIALEEVFKCKPVAVQVNIVETPEIVEAPELETEVSHGAFKFG